MAIILLPTTHEKMMCLIKDFKHTKKLLIINVSAANYFRKAFINAMVDGDSQTVKLLYIEYCDRKHNVNYIKTLLN